MSVLSDLSDKELKEYHKLVKTTTGKRKDMIEEQGYDLKFAGHIFRLLDEAEQFLTLPYAEINLQRNKEEIKAVRRGEMSLDWVEEEFHRREARLEKAYDESTLPHRPDSDKIRVLLNECLESHYGCIAKAEKYNDSLLNDLKTMISKYD
jgi:uncharacterized protein